MLAVNRLIKWINDPDNPDSSRTERIIFIDETCSDVVAFNVDKERSKPKFYKYKKIEAALENAEACLLDIDHCAPHFLTAGELKDPKYKNVVRDRDHRWEVIEPLVTGENAFRILFPHERAALIEERTKVRFKHGKNNGERTYSRQSIYAFIQLWWRCGQTKNALFGRYLKCGARGKEREQKEKKLGRPSRIMKVEKMVTGVILTKRWLHIIYLGFLLFLYKQKIRDIPTAYRKTLETFCPKGKKINEKGEEIIIIPDYTKGEVFSPVQFKYRVNKEKNRKLRRFFEKKLGKRKVNLRHREMEGDSPGLAHYPGALYQIDGTIADLYLVSRLNPKHVLGRPVIIAIIDTFSHMITGFCVRLEREGWFVISLALKNSTEDKVTFCEKYGIDIKEEEWPVIGLCDNITGDRGPMIGYKADNLADGLNIGVCNLPAHRPDWKGLIEQVFNLMNIRIIRDLPGALNPDHERGDKDVRPGARLNLEQFTAIIIKAILYHNNQHYMSEYPLTREMIADEVQPIPIEIYKWGLAHLSGRPRYRDSETIRTHLLPRDKAAVTGRGIRFKREYYTCDLAEKEGWRFRARNVEDWDIDISYDPRVPEIIYYLPPDKSPSIPCTLINPESKAIGADLAELEEYLERKAIQDEKAKVQVLQSRNNLDAGAQIIVSQAKEMYDQACLDDPDESNNSLIKNMSERRNAEIESRNLEERLEILAKSGLLEPPFSGSSTGYSRAGTSEEHVPRPRLSNVLSIQERMMEKHNEKEKRES